ncbi:hypothetical protein [Novosphingobium sp. 9]|uniref:hypothetical protein n=1 Tax=Novosphingobium sp. 9 TaxID=2025349 RepID=UPI0021B574A3|nr:hypothetical protein [Novosphingobium sp. 9]
MTGSSHSPYPTAAGRGWIPGSRDIGIPGERVGASSASYAVQRDGEREGDNPRTCPSCPCQSEGEARPDIHSGPSLRWDDERGRGEAVNARVWDAGRKVRFLHHLAEHGDVRAAAARVGVSRQSAYVLRRRDAVFAAGWRAALVLAREAAEAVLASRAMDGVEEVVWFRGEQVGVRRRYDSRLLLAHLGRLDRVAGEGAEDLSGRFDELLARVAGDQPEPALMAASVGACKQDRDKAGGETGDAALLPPSRAAWSVAGGEALESVAVDDWLARRAAGQASDADEPVADLAVWRAKAARMWDRWQAQAIARVDAILAGEDGAAESPPFEIKSLDGMAGSEAAVPGGSEDALWTVSCVSTSPAAPVRSGCSHASSPPDGMADSQRATAWRQGREGASFTVARCPALAERRRTSSSACATWAAAKSAPSASSMSSAWCNRASAAGSEGAGPVAEDGAGVGAGVGAVVRGGAGGTVSEMAWSLSGSGKRDRFQICKPPWRNRS